MRRKPNDETKGARSKVNHQTNGSGRPDLAALIKERDELRKRVAELRRDRKMLLASLGSVLSKPIKINKRKLLKAVSEQPTFEQLIAEIEQLGV
jgi:uncharacterized coiled-coil DUF342 family protein